MSASISGDVDRQVFGDLAYFNVSQMPVKKGMMVGNMIETQHSSDAGVFNPDSIVGSSDVGSALSLAAELGLLSEEQAEEAGQDLNRAIAQAGDDDPGETFEEAVREEIRAEDPSQGDNFGLNLADLKSDVEPETNAAAGAMFTSAFTLALSGRMDIGGVQGATPDGELLPENFEIVPSTVSATVGMSDQGGGRIVFELPENGTYAGAIKIDRQNPDYIIGRFGMELETRGAYNTEGFVQQGSGVVARDKPRKLKVEVDATFAARRGSVSCMK